MAVYDGGRGWFCREIFCGKARANGWESEHAGRKRKADEVDLNDGYTSKKERVAAASRKAPWAKDVDWDSCANVAEMYVTGLCCS